MIKLSALLLLAFLIQQRPTVNDKEVVIRQAFERVETTELTTSTLQVIRFRADPVNRRVVGYTDTITTETLTPTGRFEWRLRPGHFIDESTGKAYREMTDREKQRRFRGEMPERTLRLIGPVDP